jgi:hypothetical protein
MLIAPFSISPSERRGVAPRSFARVRSAKPPVGLLIAWFIVGVGVLLLVPLARGDRLLGATLPFWLIVAPLVDLGWIERRRIARRVTQGLRGLARERRAVRNVRAQRTPRAAACNAARS